GDAGPEAVTGDGERGHGRERPTAEREPLRSLWQAEQLAQPVERDELDSRRSRCPSPGGRDRVEARAEPLSEHAGERGRTRHPREVAWMVAVLHVCEGDVDESLHRGDWLLAVLRDRSAERFTQHV